MVMPDGTTVWRVTAFDGKTQSYAKATAAGVAIDVPAAKPLVFKGGKIKGSGPNAPFGLWIEAPSAAAPFV